MDGARGDREAGVTRVTCSISGLTSMNTADAWRIPPGKLMREAGPWAGLPLVSARTQRLRVPRRDREVVEPHGLMHRRTQADVGPDHQLRERHTRPRARAAPHGVRFAG